MIRRRFLFALLLTLISATSARAQQDAALGQTLATSYSSWRAAILRKDVAAWQAATAPSRQAEVRNRLISEKRAFPAGVFELPAPPPTLEGLKLLHVSQKGATAKGAWFGKVNFGVDQAPTENILVLSFLNAGGVWRYDRADFVNLAALPDVRKELVAGNLKYVEETPDFQASGTVPPTPPNVGPAKYIAKVYVFCPGREVEVQVNKISRHRFVNAKEAEIVLGGAVDGVNSISYAVKGLQGGTGKEAMAIRVYLMSEIEGTQPIKAYDYSVDENGTVKPYGSASFTVDAAVSAKLLQRR